MTTKDTNPKDSIGATKAPLSLLPLAFMAGTATALHNGRLKYGRVNWRAAGVRSSIYLDAALRHLMAWNEGEDHDADDGVDNLAAAAACLAILMDARECEMLNDDRPKSMPAPRWLLNTTAEDVRRLNDLHADKTPKHYLIDTPKEPSA